MLAASRVLGIASHAGAAARRYLPAERRKHTSCHKCTAAIRCVPGRRSFPHQDTLRKVRLMAVVKFAMNFRPRERVNLTPPAVRSLGESGIAGDLASPFSFGRLSKQNRDPLGVAHGIKSPTASWCS